MAKFTIPCFLFRQRDNKSAPSFALFAAKSAHVLEWASIRRRHQDEEGSQRRVSTSKVQAIKKFLETDERNTIPPAITVTLNVGEDNVHILDDQKDNEVACCSLSFEVADDIPEEDKPGLVIDGQHRLFGMKEFDPDFIVNVVALLTNDPLEQAFQFLVINNKVTRVPTDHLRTLVLDYLDQEEELGKRLKAARITLNPNLKYVGVIDTDERSPFKDNLLLEKGDDEKRFVPPAAIENAIDVIQNERVPELEHEDELCEFFYSMWIPIKQHWPEELWGPSSKLMYKVGIVAMTAHMTEGLVARYDLEKLDVTDPSAVQKEAEGMLELLTPKFWQSEWKVKVSDSKAVRDILIQGLKDVSRNMRVGRAWHEGLEDLIIL